MGRSSVKPRVSVQDSTGTSDLWTRAHLCSHLQATNILALGLDHLLEHEAVGRTVSLTQGPGTDCSTTLTSGGAIPSPSAQGDYPVREGVWFTRLRPVPETEAVHVCVFACCKTGRSWLLCGGGGLYVVLWRSSCAVEVRGYCLLLSSDEVPVCAIDIRVHVL